MAPKLACVKWNMFNAHAQSDNTHWWLYRSVTALTRSVPAPVRSHAWITVTTCSMTSTEAVQCLRHCHVVLRVCTLVLSFICVCRMDKKYTFGPTVLFPTYGCICFPIHYYRETINYNVFHTHSFDDLYHTE